MAKLTTQEMLAKIKQRKALAEAKKRREERLTARKTLNERTRTARPVVARKPLVEKTVAPTRKAIVETRLNARRNRPETLNESITRRNKEIGVHGNKGQNLVYSILAENIYNYGRALDGLRNPGALREATQANAGTFGAQGNGAGVGMVQTFFDIFYGYFPKLITPTIASVQPMKHEQGFIFYMQYVAGSEKGLVQKGDVLIDPFQVNTDPDYTSERVTILKGIKDAGVHTATRALWNPVKPRSVAIGNAELVWTTEEDFTGEIDGVAITDGKLTTTPTNATVTFELAAPGLDKEVDVSYAYDNVFAPTEVPELEANVERLPIQAKYRTIKTNIAFQAAYGFEAEHGADLGSKLAEAAIFQLQRETDLEAVKHIFDAAPETVVWNKSAGFAVGGYTNHKLTFEDAIVNAANRIFEKSKRVRGNVLIVGIDALNVVETLPGFDGRVIGEQLEGAGVVGKYKKMPVVAIPELPKNHWAVIYKSEVDNFDAGLVFAPYLPVFSTEPVTLDDFLIRRAFITAYAMKVVNPNYFIRGLIVSDPVAMPVYLITKDGTEENLGAMDEDAVLGIF